MPGPASLSLSKFTETVQAAVKEAVQRHPKFRVEPPTEIAISYLIRGIPVPELLAADVTLREARAFATELATQINKSIPQVEAGRAVEGAVLAHGNHLIVGIPAPEILIGR